MRFVKPALITFAITVMTLAISYFHFRADAPNCLPGQQDRRCELAMFLPLLYSLATAGAALLVSTVYFVLRHIAERRKDPLQPNV